jgi:hypothetical protein
VSRPLFFYVKKAHIGVIPGLKEYVEFFISDEIAGPVSARSPSTASCPIRNWPHPGSHGFRHVIGLPGACPPAP